MTNPSAHINTALVCLRESRIRTKKQRAYSFTLLDWAANQRRRAYELLHSKQLDMFTYD